MIHNFAKDRLWEFDVQNGYGQYFLLILADFKMVYPTIRSLLLY